MLMRKLGCNFSGSVDTVEHELDARVKYRDFYDQATSYIIDACKNYISTSADPAVLKALDISQFTSGIEETEKRKGSLINLYSAKKGSALYKVLRAMRHDHGLISCPMCGESGTPGTLDHYLPKSQFPEFSILLCNLVPACGACQSSKDAEYETSAGEKRFINPYFDDVSEPVFEVQITPPYEHPVFLVHVRANGESASSRLLLSHCDGIQLKKRFSKYCQAQYIYLLRQAHRHRTKSRSFSLRTRYEMFLENEEERGVNTWEATFYRSVLGDDDLIDYLSNSNLPKWL